jgi:hypothetical protein
MIAVRKIDKIAGKKRATIAATVKNINNDFVLKILKTQSFTDSI